MAVINPVTGKPYTGNNAHILADIAQQHGYPTCEFLTFRQALAIGRVVNKGEHGFKILKFVDEEDDAKRVRKTSRRRRTSLQKDPTDPKKRGLRQYTVFNMAQTVEMSAREKMAIKAGITQIEIPAH